MKSRIYRLAKAVFWRLPLHFGVKIRLRQILLSRKSHADVAQVPEARLLTFNEFVSFRNRGTDGVWEWQDYDALINRKQAASAPAKLTPVEGLLNVQPKKISKYVNQLSFASPQTPSLSVIIPAYEKPELSMECLLSLKKALHEAGVFHSTEVLLADDASRNPAYGEIATIEGLIVSQLTVNSGFIENCNQAAMRAKGKALLFLNNDVQINAACLQKLYAELFERSDVACVGPKLIYPSGHLQEAGTMLNVDGTAQMIGLGDDPNKSKYNFSREVDYVSGACLMIKRELFEEAGGFSNDFKPMYFEDADLSLKLQELGYKCLYVGAAVGVHRLSATTETIDGLGKQAIISANRSKFIDKWNIRLEQLNTIRALAFYLPQMHITAENDYWWGAGFTEWTNVARSKPAYEGHYQPRLPADLGFYDLTNPETLRRQADLVRRYGLAGLIFYYYRFTDGRLLDQPLELLHQNDDIDLNYCICWANENWTKRWDGNENSIIKKQDYSKDGLLATMKDFARYAQDPRYIRIDGRPVFLIYRQTDLEKSGISARQLRQYAEQAGVQDPYFVTVESMDLAGKTRQANFDGIDSACQFPPHNLGHPIDADLAFTDTAFEVNDYRVTCEIASSVMASSYKRFPGASCGWDNSPRNRVYGSALECVSPGAFQFWLEEAVRYAQDFLHDNEKIVVINAWNEWAEGAYLEPDSVFGHQYLEAVDMVLTRSKLGELHSDN